MTVQENIESKPFTHFSQIVSMLFRVRDKATRIVEDPTPFKTIYDPGHPDADERGYVQMPNVDNLIEMVDMISATRSFEANVTAFNAAKSMAIKGLEIGKR